MDSSAKTQVALEGEFPGSSGLSNDERNEILEDYIQGVAALGYKSSSIEEILAYSEMDGADFHRYFGDKEEAFIAAWYFITERSFQRSRDAYIEAPTWADRMRAVGNAVFGYLQEHPAHAKILYVEGQRAGDVGRILLERSVNFYTELIDAGRQELDDPDSVTRATAEGLAGAVYEQVSLHLARGTPAELPQLLPQLMFMVVQPYLGYEAALEELRR